jgi:hypothetical protein
MAKGRKTGGKDFEPGKSGNPAGRPPLPEDVRLAKNINQRQFELIMNDVLFLTKEELQVRYSDPKTPAVERMLVQLVRSAAWGGDPRRVDFILSRLIGKVETKVKAGEVEKPVERRPEDMTDEELEEQAQALAEKLLRAK